MPEYKKFDTEIRSLGECKFNNPFTISKYTTDNDKIMIYVENEYCEKIKSGKVEPLYLNLAGAHEKIYFNPQETRAAIVTCGGLCPGINDVIRSIFMNLYHTYGCQDIFGLRYGYEGLLEKNKDKMIRLTPKNVEKIHEDGGTMLGSSRGAQDVGEMADFMENNGIDILFAIGGDGTLTAAHLIAEELLKRGLKRSVIGVPKTIDNDISHVAKSFGFETAFAKAHEALQSAHMEARGARNGIGLVKLMGRHSGFITAYATLANRDVNYCLIPEIDFDLDGDNGLLNNLRKRLVKRGHAVVVVAEGAGQKFFDNKNLGLDKSGNKKLGDIGTFLKKEIVSYFKEHNMEATVKYIDPSYIIRSVPANSNDSLFCGFLGQMAVHAAMAGKTDMIVGVWNDMFTHVPIASAIQERKKVDVNEKLWFSVLQTTGQPDLRNR